MCNSDINLHLIAFVEIRLFNVFFWERKTRFKKLMKNVHNVVFSRKRSWTVAWDQDHSPLLDLEYW